MIVTFYYNPKNLTDEFFPFTFDLNIFLFIVLLTNGLSEVSSITICVFYKYLFNKRYHSIGDKR